MISGAESYFRCRHPNADAIVWRINGTFLNMLPDSLYNFLYLQDSGQTLTVTADPQLNMSSIQCVAVFIGRADIPASPVTLKIQGVLSSNHNLFTVYCFYCMQILAIQYNNNIIIICYRNARLS